MKGSENLRQVFIIDKENIIYILMTMKVRLKHFQKEKNRIILIQSMNVQNVIEMELVWNKILNSL